MVKCVCVLSGFVGGADKDYDEAPGPLETTHFINDCIQHPTHTLLSYLFTLQWFKHVGVSEV